jgi:ankyrin repeat protein
MRSLKGDETRRGAKNVSKLFCSWSLRCVFLLNVVLFHSHEIASQTSILRQSPRILRSAQIAFQSNRVRSKSRATAASPHTSSVPSHVDIERPSDHMEAESGHPQDGRPFEQRVERPRPARRMNHPFKYLYRHDFNATTTPTDPLSYLMNEGGYTHAQVVQMNQTFPVLLELSVQRQLHPKMQFLKHTMGQRDPSAIAHLVPSFYFGLRLERILAPRHAFLVWAGLPSGQALFDLKSKQSSTGISKSLRLESQCLFQDFIVACRNSKRFAALCQSWREEWQFSVGNNNTGFATFPGKITSKDIEAFDAIFLRGLMAAVRNDLVQPNNTWPAEQLPTLEASDVVRLLIQHGAYPLAKDHRGATLLHWACGTGHWEAARHILPYYPISSTATRDGATPLHWAAAGTTTREFGVGGHVDVCLNLLTHLKNNNQQCSGNYGTLNSRPSLTEYVNRLTYDGNSALMWAAWSGTLETVKLLVRSTADTTVANRNGCTVAHWAASGGNLKVCMYLSNTANVDFSVPNYGGNTPLSHAVAFGRTDVVQWLLKLLSEADNDEMMAYSLAQDFVQWTKGDDAQRKQVLQLFENDWLSTDMLTSVTEKEIDEDDFY